MAEMRNVRLVLEWNDPVSGEPQSVRWEVDQAKVTHNESKNVTNDHLELLRNGQDVTVRASLELKMDYASIVKGEEKK